MRNHQFSHLSNQRGGVVLISMIIISVVLAIFSGIVSFKLTEMSKHSYRVNEAYRYLNIMEEMGGIVSHARELGAAGSCPGGTTLVTVGTHPFCLPGTGLGTTCVEDETQKDPSGANIKYCLKTTGGLSPEASLNKKDRSNIADMSMDIVPVKAPSLLERAIHAVVSPVFPAYAACPPTQDWRNPCTPDNDATGSFSEIDLAPSISPVAYTVAPAGASTGSTTSYASRNNLEPWTPTITTWTPGGSNSRNEIFTPSCNITAYSGQYWLGCMSCSDTNVLCIDMNMCPPRDGANCAQPYRQRIAIYGNTF